MRDIVVNSGLSTSTPSIPESVVKAMKVLENISEGDIVVPTNKNLVYEVMRVAKDALTALKEEWRM